jgi:hypothetical protein
MPNGVYTLKSKNGVWQRITLPVIVQNPTTAVTAAVTGILDTGCNMTSLSRGLAWRLGLPRRGDGFSRRVGSRASVLVYEASIIIPENIEFSHLFVADFLGAEPVVLIGMDIITKCDLAITDDSGNTVLTYRRPHGKDFIDFTKVSSR